MQSLNDTAILLRLAHAFGIHEDATSSQPVQVDLSQLLNPQTGIKIITIDEVSLTNNQLKSELVQRRAAQAPWRADTDTDTDTDTAAARGGKAGKATEVPHVWRQQPAFHFHTNPVVTLGPLEIKTFVITTAAVARGGH